MIFNVDNMLIGFLSIDENELEVGWKDSSIREKFEKYYNFQ